MIRPVLATSAANVAVLLLGCWATAVASRNGEVGVQSPDGRDGWWAICATRSAFLIGRARTIDLDSMDDRQIRAFAGEPRFVDRGWLGFHWGCGVWEHIGPVRGSQYHGPKYAADQVGRGVIVGVPAVPLAAAFAVAPAVYWTRRVRSARRRQAGRCVGCGYDLRATAGRCPECGRPASPVTRVGRPPQ